MLDPSREHVSTRTLALIPILLFLPPVASFLTDPGARWAEYFGVFFHLSMLCLISRLPAPAWARAAGFGWVTIDVTVGVLVINGVPDDFSGPMRLGGHVLAGTWIITCAAHSAGWPIRISGAVTGIWLAGYSFVGDVLPRQALAPASLLLIVWLALIAFYAKQESVANADGSLRRAPNPPRAR
ncbi:hypothetical protein [Mycolicibacterium baixiangningiae]|uniref:hypothetical protein n=1 Tax=Mycolicibacterium baixiangningiae TaxID=2761578 RepID=UPI0018D0D6FA|nr:hypothetical protein [Mycolicibacterium baixiangningiae]